MDISKKRITKIALSLMLAGTALAQSAPAKMALVVNGRKTDGAVVQIGGHSYVDVDTLAQIMKGTVSFEPGRVILTLPDIKAGAATGRTAVGLSKDFAKASIFQLAETREWKGAISSAIRAGVAAGTWLGPLLQEHRARAEASLSQASLAVRTESDRRALQLLKNEFSNLGQWDSNTQATIHSLNAEQSINPAAVQDDPLLTKISECSNFLNAMLVGGEYADNPNCH